MELLTCPRCQQTAKQHKIGRNPSGSQRYRCGYCSKKYTPVPTHQGYAAELRKQAIQLSVDGLSFRRIARHLEVDHQTVANWVKAHAATLPASPPLPPLASNDVVPVVEMDELYTFEGEKKTGLCHHVWRTSYFAVSLGMMWPLIGEQSVFNRYSIRRHRLSSTIPITALPIPIWSSILGIMRRFPIKVRPIPLKKILRNYDIISLAWLVVLDVLLALFRRYGML